MDAMWILMLITDFLIPLAMIGFGQAFMRAAPAQINSLFGYRTCMSMKNRQTWEFAHRYFGKLWFVIGLILLPLTLIFMLLFWRSSIDTIGIAGTVIVCVQCIPMLLPILPTERALKRAFDENGNRKNV